MSINEKIISILDWINYSVYRLLKSIFIFLILFFYLLAFLLSSDKIQSSLLASMTDYLSKRTNYHVTLESVKIDISDGLKLNNLLIKDLHNDTMIYAKSFNTSLLRNIAPMIFNKNYDFSKIHIVDGIININRLKDEPMTNIEQFIKNLKLPKSNSTDCTHINFKSVSIDNTRVKFDIFQSNNKINAYIGKSKIDFDKFDNCNNDFIITDAILEKPDVEILEFKGSNLPNKNNDSDELKIGINLLVKNFKISDGKFNLKDFAKNIKGNQLSMFENPALSNIDLQFNNVKLNTSGQIGLKIKNLSFKDKSGFRIENFKSDSVLVSNQRIFADKVELFTKDSELHFRLALNFENLGSFKSFNDKVLIETDIVESKVRISDIKYFLNKIPDRIGTDALLDDDLYIDGKIQGTINNFYSSNIVAELSELSLTSDFQCQNITESNPYMKINNLLIASNSAYLIKLFPELNNSIAFDKLGGISITGNFDGSFNEFRSKAQVITDLGNADLDINLKRNVLTKDISYWGDIGFKNFLAGVLVKEQNLGRVNGNVKILQGKNFKIDNINAMVKGKLDSIEFKGYKYHDVVFDGNFQSRKFAGALKVQDLNFDLVLDGKIDYSSDIPKYNFTAKLKDADLKALKLYKTDLFVDSDINIDMEGSNAENFKGRINLKNISISDGDQLAKIDSINVYSESSPTGERFMDGQSDFMSFYFDGRFRIDDLPDAMYSLIDEHFSKFMVGFENYKPKNKNYDNYHYNFNFTINDSKNIMEILFQKEARASFVSIDGVADHRRDSIKFAIKADSLIYDNIKVGNVTSNFNLYDGYGEFQLKSKEILLNKIKFSNFTFDTDVDENSLYFHTNVDSIGDKKNSLALSGKTVPHRDSFEILIYGGVVIAYDSTYQFTGENKLVLAKNYINLYDFKLQTSSSSLVFEDINNNKGIKANFKNIDIDGINLLIDDEKLKFEGKADGFVEVTNIFKPELFESQFEIPNLKIGKNHFDLLKSHVLIDPNEKNKILFNVVIGGENPILLATGNYNTERKSIFGDFTFDDFPLSFLENVIYGEISETEGIVNGNLLVKGPVEKFEISGKGEVLNGMTKLNYTNVKYNFDKQKFTLNNNGIDFTGVTLKDEFGNVANVNGSITYRLFKNWGIDLEAKSDNITMLNTDKNINPDYWGFCTGPAVIRLKGKFDDLVDMNIRATSAKGSNLTIPVRLSVDVEGGSFIDFSKQMTDLNNSQTPIIKTKNGKIQLEIYVDVTEDAYITLILDENTGDYLRGTGKGIIRMVMDKDEEFEVFGDYKFSQGKYVFRYKLLEVGLIDKQFEIRPGSSIIWAGDPFDARMDVKADYKANRISLKNLLGEYTTITDASYTADVDLILLLTGTLQNPQIGFDFNFNEIDERIRSQLLSKTQRLRSDPNALFTQAVSLLVFVSFLPDQSFQTVQNQSLINSGISGSVNTLSELISNQISQYITGIVSSLLSDNKIISGVDISFDSRYNTFISNQEQSSGLGAQHLNMNATVWLFNDKVYIRLGGDYNYLDNSSSLNSRTNYFSQGNMDFGYVITKDKRLKLNVNFKTEFNELLGNWENKSGIGLGYGKDFGRIIKNK